MKHDDWKEGRWLVSSVDHWEGIFPGAYDTREEAVEAGPTVMRENGFAAELDEEGFFVSQITTVSARIPDDITKTVFTAIYERTFRNWEERPEKKFPPHAETALSNRLHRLLKNWANDYAIFEDELCNGNFELIMVPAVEPAAA